jgi:hypothetical protein
MLENFCMVNWESLLVIPKLNFKGKMQNLGEASDLKRSHDEYIVKNEIHKGINYSLGRPHLRISIFLPLEDFSKPKYE